MISTLGSFVGGVLACSFFFVGNDIFNGLLQKFISMFWITTVVTNFLATTLILARLYLAERGQHIQLGRLTMRPVITVVLESGVIYCVTCIIGFALFFSGNNAQVIVLNGLNSLIIILFTSVLLRISNPNHTTPNSFAHSRSTHSHPQHDIGARQPLEINVHRFIEMDHLGSMKTGSADADRK